MKKKKLKVELNTMLKKKGLGNNNISCFEDQDPFLHCKALRTAMYKRYINSIIIIIIIIIS